MTDEIMSFFDARAIADLGQIIAPACSSQEPVPQTRAKCHLLRSHARSHPPAQAIKSARKSVLQGAYYHCRGRARILV